MKRYSEKTIDIETWRLDRAAKLANIEVFFNPHLYCTFSYPLNVPHKKQDPKHIQNLIRYAAKNNKACLEYRGASGNENSYKDSVHIIIKVSGNHSDQSELELIANIQRDLYRGWTELCKTLLPKNKKDTLYYQGIPALVRDSIQYAEHYNHKNDTWSESAKQIVGNKLGYNFDGKHAKENNYWNGTALSRRQCRKAGHCTHCTQKTE